MLISCLSVFVMPETFSKFYNVFFSGARDDNVLRAASAHVGRKEQERVRACSETGQRHRGRRRLHHGCRLN